MLKIIPLMSAALLALSVPLIAQDGGPVLRVVGGEDQIVQIRAKTRHTTVIVLPATETVLDFVVGDSEYWHLTGAANLAFLKPIAEGVTTNVALVCESGRIYSFLVTEGGASDPHLVVRVEAREDADPRVSPTRHEPAFVARGQVAAYQQMAETAIKTAKAAQQDADSRIADATALAANESEAFRAEYPNAPQVPLPIRRQGAQVAVPGRGNVARRALYLPSLELPGVARAVRREGWETGAGGLRSGRGRAVYRPPCSRQRLVADRQTESSLALRRAGDRAMIEWKRLYAKPAGSLPGGVVTQWGVAIIAIGVLVVLTAYIFLGDGEEAELAPGARTEQAPAGSYADRMASRIEAESQRAETRRAAADRALREQERQQRQQAAGGGGIGAGQVSVDEAMSRAGPSPDTGQPYTQEEWQLRERLRLEALERRSRSLRSSPLAQTYRQLDGSAAAAEKPVAATKTPDESMTARREAALEQALDTIGTVTTGLEDQIAAEAQAEPSVY